MSKRTNALRDKSIPELEQELRQAQQEITTVKFQLATRQMSNYAQIRTLRHDIARLHFFIAERRREQEMQNDLY